jgi:hypothetical protein
VKTPIEAFDKRTPKAAQKKSESSTSMKTPASVKEEAKRKKCVYYKNKPMTH